MSDKNRWRSCWCGKPHTTYCEICKGGLCSEHSKNHYKLLGIDRRYSPDSLEAHVIINHLGNEVRHHSTCEECVKHAVGTAVQIALEKRKKWSKKPLDRYVTAKAQNYLYSEVENAVKALRLEALLSWWAKEASQVGIKMISTHRYVQVTMPQQPQKKRFFAQSSPPPPKVEDRHEEVKAWKFETISIGEQRGGGPAGFYEMHPVYDSTFLLPNGELLLKSGALLRTFIDKDAWVLVPHMATMIIEARGPRYKW